jgi:prolyl-tRNA synthetase
VINSFFAKWVQSHRDLPLLINQWANVVRWELRPRLFLRTSEFLWQEGHTAHATEADARAYALRILADVYVDTMVEVAGIPVLTGQKTARERFAGAIQTWTCEAMMGDGKALQMGTSHELGQNFARAFDIQFANEAGAREYVWQTSWGVSTRLIGALIMAHGDDAGLRLPPALAPLEVVVVLVREEPGARAAAESLVATLVAAGHRVRLDDRVDTSFGRRSVDWELKGVPARVEIGPRDLAEGNVTVVTRHTRSKATVAVEAAAAEVGSVLARAGDELREEALAFRRSRTVEVSTAVEAVEAAGSGFARIPWSVLGEAGEAELAAESVSVRCLRPAGAGDAAIGEVGPGEKVDEASLVAVVARSY